MSSITPVTRAEKNLLSNLRCIKYLNTSEDLKTAINKTTATVKAPRYICVRKTDISASTISKTRTIRNVLYGII
jgi:hypothetical protein